MTIPPLRIALGYEAIFQLPVSALFRAERAPTRTRRFRKKLELSKRRLKGGNGVETSVVAAKELEWLITNTDAIVTKPGPAR